MNDRQKTVLVHAINHFGVEANIDKALEEMGELTTELSRRRLPRYDKEKVAEEIADVLITVEKLRIIFGGSRVDEKVEEKLARLEDEMDGDWRRQERMMPKGMVVHRSESLACYEIGKAAAAGFEAGMKEFDPEIAEKVKRATDAILSPGISKTATEIATEGEYAELYDHMKRLQPRRACLYCKHLGSSAVEGLCDAVCGKSGDMILGNVSQMCCANFEPYLEGAGK